jgi:hypothetical protein
MAERDPEEIAQMNTLGTVRLRHIETNDIILIPTPSSDPNDPLNWSVFALPGATLFIGD